MFYFCDVILHNYGCVDQIIVALIYYVCLGYSFIVVNITEIYTKLIQVGSNASRKHDKNRSNPQVLPIYFHNKPEVHEDDSFFSLVLLNG